MIRDVERQGHKIRVATSPSDERKTIENSLRILRTRQADGNDMSPVATAGLISGLEADLRALPQIH